MQQPPNSGGFPPQQPYQPPFPPSAGQPTPRRRRRRLWIIIASIAGVTLLACVLCGVIGTNLSKSQATTVVTPTATASATSAQIAATSPTVQPTSAPTLVPTATPAPRPTASPTHSVQASGPATLGGPVAAFIAKYGPSDTSCASCTAGVYAFKRYQGTQLDYLEVMIIDSDSAHKGHVNAFLVQTPPNADWDTATATAICESFGPSDANYGRAEKVITAPDGSSVQKIYQSAWLAQQLITSDFTDANANPVAPGTFSLFYSYDSPNHVSSCSVEAGIPAS